MLKKALSSAGAKLQGKSEPKPSKGGRSSSPGGSGSPKTGGASQAAAPKTSTAAKQTKKESRVEKPAARSAGGKASSASKTATGKSAAAKGATKGKVKGERASFLEAQRALLEEEKAGYLRSAESLKAQADSLALEHEPGDVQFDEEGGEGGNSNIEREMDLVLSAQARAAAVEIDRALEKIELGTYGDCEQCGQPIPQARLQALPYAALCVSCKSGGLSSRR